MDKLGRIQSRLEELSRILVGTRPSRAKPSLLAEMNHPVGRTDRERLIVVMSQLRKMRVQIALIESFRSLGGLEMQPYCLELGQGLVEGFGNQSVLEMIRVD